MKVDTTQIEGYDEMTAEEKIAALEGFEIEPPKGEEEKLKELLSKRNAEIGEVKKKLRERMTAEEQAEADRKAALEAKDARIAELEKNEKLNSYTNAYMGIGFSAEDARRQAELLYEGDFMGVIANNKAHIDNVSKQALSDAITKSHLSTGEPPKSEDVDMVKLRKAMGLPT